MVDTCVCVCMRICKHKEGERAVLEGEKGREREREYHMSWETIETFNVMQN